MWSMVSVNCGTADISGVWGPFKTEGEARKRAHIEAQIARGALDRVIAKRWDISVVEGERTKWNFAIRTIRAD